MNGKTYNRQHHGQHQQQRLADQWRHDQRRRQVSHQRRGLHRSSGGSASFGSANAGSRDRHRQPDATLQGTDAANYTLTAPTASATISARGDHPHRLRPEPDLRLFWRHERGRWDKDRLQAQQWHDLMVSDITEGDAVDQRHRSSTSGNNYNAGDLDHHALERQRLEAWPTTASPTRPTPAPSTSRRRR